MAAGQERILRQRIRSIQSTKKITRAMELIAASRISKAQAAITAARPYVEAMASLLRSLADNHEASRHPVFAPDDPSTAAMLIVVAADRGLCGAYNSNVLRTAERRIKDLRAAGREVELVLVGKKAQGYFRHRGFDTTNSFIGITDRPTFEDAQAIADKVVSLVAEKGVGLVEVVGTEFISAGLQAVDNQQLLPVVSDTPEEYWTPSALGHTVDYEFEPDAGELINRVVPKAIETRVFGALLNAAASEHAARQRAMKSATDNADELAKKLTRLMNRARQDSITTEIMEIIGGAEALNQVEV